MQTPNLSEARLIIQEKTGYFIRSKNRLSQVFRRSSYAAETGQNSNEIYEFIGDQVLSFYLVKSVSKRCGSMNLTGDYTFKINENRFTQIKQQLLSNQTLANIIDEWDIAKYLRLGKSDIKNEAIKQPKVKADLFEAIIGAIAIECNWDPSILDTAIPKALNIEELLQSLIENEPSSKQITIDHAVTILKEMAEHRQCTMPEYTFSALLGYDKDGNPRWSCTCRIINDKTGITKVVEAASKSDAKKAAAYLILCAHFDIPNQYGPTLNLHNIWTYKNGNLLPDREEE